MAYDSSWATVNPASGSGSPSGVPTSWTATARTGRSQRDTWAAYKAGTITRNVHIIQAGAALALTTTNPNGGIATSGGRSASLSIANTGGTITISGNSNAKKITFSSLNDSQQDQSTVLPYTVPGTYTAAGSSASNGVNITNDPGEVQSFAFSIALVISANETVNTLTSVFRIVAEGDNNETVTLDITLTQTAGDAYLFLNSKDNIQDVTINLNDTGTPAQTVTVISNTTWTIE